MAMTWKVTEHMIFLLSLAVICSFSHLRSGLSLVSMMNSYLQSSQQRVSELLIHCCRQAWWTKHRLPVQWHGVIRGLSSSPSQWQILQMSWLEGDTDVLEKLHGALTEVGLPAFDILLDLLAEWPRGFSFCLSLSLDLQLPDTRDEVTSRGMTEIWCSGIFIPAEPSRDAHTHTSCPTARAKGMMVQNCDTSHTPPLNQNRLRWPSAETDCRPLQRAIQKGNCHAITSQHSPHARPFVRMSDRQPATSFSWI